MALNQRTIANSVASIYYETCTLLQLIENHPVEVHQIRLGTTDLSFFH